MDAGSDNEQRFRALVDNAFDVIVECAASGRILYAGPSITDVLGIEPRQIIGTFLVELLHPDDVRLGAAAFFVAVREARKIVATLRYRHKNGTWRSIEGRGRSYVSDKGKQRVVIIGRDVTDNDLAEERLHLTQQRLQLQLNQLPVAVIGWDVDGRVDEWNPAAEQMFGFRKDEVIGTQAAPLLQSGGGTATDIAHEISRAAQGAHPPLRISAEHKRKDGSTILCIWTIAPLVDDKGTTNGVLSIVEDVTAIARARRLEEFAYQDPVTRLPNRRFFDDRLAASANSTRRKDEAFAVLFIDLDGFKEVNDRFGHEVGDTALMAVGRRLLCCVRDGDVVGRLGGDEFGVLLMELEDVDYPEIIARRILAALSTPLKFGDISVHVSASIGISMFPLDGRDPASLLRQADAAMYRAKQHGPGTYSL